MKKKQVTTEDLLIFMQENLVTKKDLDEKLAAQKYEILDVMDRKFADSDRRMNLRFEAVDRRFDAMDTRFDKMDDRFDAMDDRFDAMDERFDSLTEILHERKLIDSDDVAHLNTLKPAIMKD